MVGGLGDTRVRLRLVDIAPLICRGLSSKRWIKRSNNPHPRSWYNFNYYIATFDTFSHIKICHFHMCDLNYITYNADLDHQSLTVGSCFPVLSSPWQTWFFASIILPFIFVKLEGNSPTSIGTGGKKNKRKKAILPFSWRGLRRRASILFCASYNLFLCTPPREHLPCITLS